MARTNFTPIKEALNTLINSIAGMHADILAKANAERREALDLYARMQDTYQDLTEFNGMVAGAADALAGVDEVATDIGCKMVDVLEGGFGCIPDCNYEEFIGFCTGCGNTITDQDEWEYVDGEIYHNECSPLYEEEEVTEYEQLELPIDEAADEDVNDIENVEADEAVEADVDADEEV